MLWLLIFEIQHILPVINQFYLIFRSRLKNEKKAHFKKSSEERRNALYFATLRHKYWKSCKITLMLFLHGEITSLAI